MQLLYKQYSFNISSDKVSCIEGDKFEKQMLKITWRVLIVKVQKYITKHKDSQPKIKH